MALSDLFYNNHNNYNKNIYDFYIAYRGDWKFGYLTYSNHEYLNNDGICHCNPKNTQFEKLLLCFSDLYTDCKLCNNYLIDDEKEQDENELDFNTDKEYKEIKTLIQLKPELVFVKNYMGLYPFDFIDLLHKILTIMYNGTSNGNGTYYARHIKEYINKIADDIELEYFKYELSKYVACKYIKNSNHIGNDATQLQLPLHIWKYIFTFI